MNHTPNHPTSSVHREIVLEQHLVSQLVQGQGYAERSPEDYDRLLALDKALVLRFVRETQPDEWLKLEAQYAASAELEFFKQLEKALKQRGTLDVLRQGIKLIPGIRFALCFFEPASKLNPDLDRLYESNVLCVIRQVRYSLKERECDRRGAVRQWHPCRHCGTEEPADRLDIQTRGKAIPHRPITRWRAATDIQAWGSGPFRTRRRQRFDDHPVDERQDRFSALQSWPGLGAGNSDISGEFRVAYLYADQPEGKAIFSRDVWLDVIGRLVHLEQGDDGRATMIFPRFQQLDAVRRMMADARAHGVGGNYLIQHSAGSGKSNTIGWTAHQAINLHDETDQPIFDTAIIVTDRIVLDRQLQGTVSQFEQTRGVVRKIDGTSRQLKDAIERGARIIFFAFTATPRNVTLERFGTRGPDGLPRPFHLYSMRQAIEEGFILDVLQYYMTYQAYFQLEKAIEDDPELNSRRGQRTVARYASLHPTHVGQKVEIIVEHFRRHVMCEINRQAKAMIVTQSREHTLRYYLGVRDYIKQESYTDLKALVAFSGDLVLDGEPWTEAALNGFSETELPRRFDGIRPNGTPYPDQYQILIVAEKYQTGFAHSFSTSKTRLKTFRRPSGPTTRRRNSNQSRTRTRFTNWRPNSRLLASSTMARSSASRRFSTRGRSTRLIVSSSKAWCGKRSAALRRMTMTGGRKNSTSFSRAICGFTASLPRSSASTIPASKKLYAYAAWLIRLLPDREIPPDIEITDEMLRLQAFKVEQKEAGNASLRPGDHATLKPISEFAAKPYTEDEKRSLAEIIHTFNERHGTQFTEADFLRFEQVNREILDEDVTEMLRNNPPDVVFSAFSQAFFQGAIKMFQRDNEMKNIVLSDPDVRAQAIRHFFGRALRQAREAPPM